MLSALVIMVILLCAAFMFQEGLFSAGIVFFCAVISGLVAFSYFEPLADLIELYMGSFAPYADILSMLGIFSLTVSILRLTTDQLAPTMIELPGVLHHSGGVAFGVLLGWMMAGMLVCALQTLPLHQNFMGYSYRNLESGNAFNADRHWLAFVDRASRGLFETDPARPFDPRADFIIRYHHFRRTDDEGNTARGAAAAEADVPVRVPRANTTGRRRGT